MADRLADTSWPDIPDDALVLVPLGSTEQHGPHLPLSTDTLIARAVARRAAGLLPGRVLVAPAIPYGASGEHAGFPGTVSIGHEALRHVLVETVRSLALWADRVAFVNGHGGNAETLRAAVVELRHQGHDVGWVGCEVPDGDAHAGFTETSVLLHLAPEHVLMRRAAPGDRRPLAALMPRLRAAGVRAVSPTGVLGDPTGACADQGRRILRELAADAASRLAAWRADDQGGLSR
ncbi:mycofactocin biosynthesis peptidyl-dipeptidase MftE [Streptomyces flaveus]|uniref:mycofactocin biosynthesis peptidyl-dipeptidase MftE n=1 Tax=Streptomyces flaveus TaxID=66370 RepID=UPI00166F9774|nr:mycofactocin biosynthesis peptidyl-dipeptidase MftE [Streptomyces flaveus]